MAATGRSEASHNCRAETTNSRLILLTLLHEAVVPCLSKALHQHAGIGDGRGSHGVEIELTDQILCVRWCKSAQEGSSNAGAVSNAGANGRSHAHSFPAFHLVDGSWPCAADCEDRTVSPVWSLRRIRNGSAMRRTSFWASACRERLINREPRRNRLPVVASIRPSASREAMMRYSVGRFQFAEFNQFGSALRLPGVGNQLQNRDAAGEALRTLDGFRHALCSLLSDLTRLPVSCEKSH